MKKYLLLLILFVVFVFSTNSQTKKYVTYTVKKGESLKSIARDFNIKARELYDLNPDIDRKPSENTVILIPIEVEEIEKSETFQYKVSPKETLFAIAKKFEITVEEIIKLNPSLESGLKDGQIILIPKSNNLSTNNTRIEIKADVVVPDNNIYKVVKGDTMYNLAKRYQTTEDELLRLNPILREGLKLDQEIILPNTTVKTVKFQPVKSVDEIAAKEISYTVEKGDTFYSLTKRFQLSEDALIALNPELKSGMKEGMELKIVTEKSKDANYKAVKSEFKSSDKLTFKSGKSIDVVLMMPFKLNEVEDVGVHFNNSTSLLNITSEFYQGAMVAIDSLRSLGAEINLKSFDSENNDDKLLSLLKGNNLANTDVFIGPLFLSGAHHLAKNISNGFVVAPMNSKDHTKYNDSNLIKTGVSNTVLEDKMLRFMKRTYAGENIIVIGDNKPGTALEADRISAKLKLNSSISNITILKPINSYITIERFKSVLSSNRKNWILLVGDDNVVITDAVNTYGIIDKSIDISLFKLNNEGNIENANNNYLARLQYTFPALENINSNNIEVLSFFKNYKNRYFVEPSNMAIRGFDVTFDTLFRILDNGSNFGSIDHYKYERVASRFDYKTTSTSGFENTGIYILKIEPDLSLTILE